MEKITYKTVGTMLVPGKDGGLIPKQVEMDAEDPYSEEKLKRAEKIALAGTIHVIPDESPVEKTDKIDPVDQLFLKDSATGIVYQLYIENGKLMKEVR